MRTKFLKKWDDRLKVPDYVPETLTVKGVEGDVILHLNSSLHNFKYWLAELEINGQKVTVDRDELTALLQKQPVMRKDVDGQG